MTREDIKDLKGRFFDLKGQVPHEFVYIENIKFYEKDKENEFVIELRVTNIHNNTIDGRRRLECYGSDRHVKINDVSVSPEYILEHIWNCRNVKEITPDEFKNEFFRYIDETYYRIYGTTIN